MVQQRQPFLQKPSSTKVFALSCLQMRCPSKIAIARDAVIESLYAQTTHLSDGRARMKMQHCSSTLQPSQRTTIDASALSLLNSSKVGGDGVITIEEGGDDDTKHYEGMQSTVDTFHHILYWAMSAPMEIVLEDAYVLICENTLRRNPPDYRESYR